MEYYWTAITYIVGLSAMEIVLGIDNIVFITIVTGRLPESERPKARNIGLLLAMVMRLVLLLFLSWILSLQTPIFSWTDLGVPAKWLGGPGSSEVVGDSESQPRGDAEDHGRGHASRFEERNGVSWKDLILLVGGLFLIGKSVHEIDKKIGADDEEHLDSKTSFASVLLQILLLDMIFSLDSVIVAVGMVPPDFKWAMFVSVILAVLVMLAFAGPVSRFVSNNPTLKMLALSFLILIGVMLVAEATGTHVDKGYIYFAMAFALVVELLNLKMKANSAARKLAKGNNP